MATTERAATGVPAAPDGEAAQPSPRLETLLLANTWDVIHVLDAEGRIRFITPSIERLLGRAPGEFIDRMASDFVHPDDQERAQRSFEEAIETPGWGGSVEVRLRHRDGSWRWVAASASQVVEGGAPVLVVNSHDITDRKETERSLAAAEERFRLLAEQSLVGIYIISGESFLYVNPTFADIMGYTQTEMMSVGVMDVVAEEDRELVARNIRQRLEGAPATKRYRFRARRKDGVGIVVEVHGTRAGLDGRTVILGSLSDVTERVRWEAALHQSEERYRKFFEEDLTGDVLTRPDGSIVACNHAFAEMLGFRSPGDAIGVNMASLHLDPADRQDIVARLLKERKIQAHEMELRRPDGSVICVLQNVVGSFDVRGKLTEIRRYLFDISDRKRAERALEQRERRFRAIFNGTVQFMGLLRPDGTVLEANSPVLEFAGVEAKDVLGRPLWELDPFQISDSTRRRVERAVRSAAGGQLVRFEMEVGAAGGSPTHIDFSIKPIRDSQGRVSLLVPEARDITERKRMEEEVRASEERLRLVSLATNDTIWDLDPVSGQILWNDTASLLFRCGREQLGNLEWWYERIHPNDRERVIRDFHAAVEGQAESWSGEYRMRRGDGTYTTVLDRGYVVRNENGVATRVVGSMLDVTERKRQEEVQRFLSEASAVLDSSLDYDTTLRTVARLAVPTIADYCLIDIVDEDAGQVRRVAAAHADPSRESLLRHEYRVSLADDPQRHPVLPVVRSGESVLVPEVTDEILARISDDEESRAAMRRLELHSYIIVPMVARERTLGAITLAAAASQRRYDALDLLLAGNLARRAALAVDNARLYQEAREAVRARDDILAVVSHDLRNPLSAIGMSASLILENTERRSANRRALEIIQRNVEHMEVLIRDLLDITRIESGRLRLDSTALRVDTMLADVREVYAPLAAAKGISLQVANPAPLPLVYGDADRVRQVFSNLVGNALKFTPDGGTVTVEASERSDAVCFAVRDTGPGIPPANLPHLFDRFWQGKGAARQGVGLGLAITRGIVEAHGGHVWVESDAGRGSAFLFTLPAAGAPAPPERA